jgi:hypothetical protein
MGVRLSPVSGSVQLHAEGSTNDAIAASLTNDVRIHDRVSSSLAAPANGSKELPDS